MNSFSRNMDIINSIDNETRCRLENGRYIDLLEASLPSESEPNYRRWRDYCLLGIVRGRNCVKVLSGIIQIEGANVLDFGCGDGGHAVAFAEAGATVTGLDIDAPRLEKAKALAEDFGVFVDFRLDLEYGESLAPRSFDIIICNDVIEHVGCFDRLAQSHKGLLKNEGLLYLQAPNRFSLKNILEDPHFGLFGISLLGPRIAGTYVTKVRRRKRRYDVNRFLGWYELNRIYKKAGLKLTCLPNEELLNRLRTPQLLSRWQRIVLASFSTYFVLCLYRVLWTQSWTVIGTHHISDRK